MSASTRAYRSRPSLLPEGRARGRASPVNQLSPKLANVLVYAELSRCSGLHHWGRYLIAEMISWGLGGGSGWMRMRGCMFSPSDNQPNGKKRLTAKFSAHVHDPRSHNFSGVISVPFFLFPRSALTHDGLSNRA